MSLFREINTENKLRLTLTYLAMNTLREDQEYFDIGIAALVNRIITHYSPDANASISMKLAIYRNNLASTLSGTHADVIELLVKAEEKRLIASIPAYRDTPGSFLLRISNANIFLLTEDTTSHEELYYPKGIKGYVQALVEEFCRLPFIEREKIYCREIYNQLLQAMNKEYAVYIIHSYGKKYLSRIYAITSDPLSTYSYVVCRLINPQNKKMDGRIYSFRLSRILQVIEKPSISGAFTDAEKKSTADAIAKNGVQFITDRINTVVVEFTDEGLKLFNSSMHLRPQVTKIYEDKHTYEFQCTSGQAVFYFRRLGASAKVIKPAFVAEELAKWYQDAAVKYSENL